MHGEYKSPDGKLVAADSEVRDGRLAEVKISGDFFLESPRGAGPLPFRNPGADLPHPVISIP